MSETFQITEPTGVTPEFGLLPVGTAASSPDRIVDRRGMVQEIPRTSNTATDMEQPFPETSPLRAGRATHSAAKRLAEWSGYVTDIGDYFFRASLRGVFGEGVKGEHEDAEIPISDLSLSDRELLRQGAYLRLCVMREVRKSGQPSRFTQVILRRLPDYSEDELRLAADEAGQLLANLRVE